jgi:hypothetical protein
MKKRKSKPKNKNVEKLIVYLKKIVNGSIN